MTSTCPPRNIRGVGRGCTLHNAASGLAAILDAVEAKIGSIRVTGPLNLQLDVHESFAAKSSAFSRHRFGV